MTTLTKEILFAEATKIVTTTGAVRFEIPAANIEQSREVVRVLKKTYGYEESKLTDLDYARAMGIIQSMDMTTTQYKLVDGVLQLATQEEVDAFHELIKQSHEILPELINAQILATDIITEVSAEYKYFKI